MAGTEHAQDYRSFKTALPYFGRADNPVEKVWWRLKHRIAANGLPGFIVALVEAIHEFFASFTPEVALRLVV